MVEMAHTLRGGLFLLVHSRHPPDDASWDAYLEDVRRMPSLEAMRTLVLTEGGGPNVRQRAALNAELRGQRTRVAVVSSSIMVQGIISTLGLFNRDIRWFSPPRLADAYAHVGVRGLAHWDVHHALVALCVRVGIPGP